MDSEGHKVAGGGDELAGIDAVASILPVSMTLTEAVRDGEELPIAATECFMRTLMPGVSIAEARLIGDDW